MEEDYGQYGLTKDEWDALSEEERWAYRKIGTEENKAEGE